MRFVYPLKAARLEMLTVGPTPEEEARISEHFLHLKGLAERGVVLHIGRTATNDENTVGIVVFEATDLAEAERIVESDPAVRSELMRANLFPYRQVHPE